MCGIFGYVGKEISVSSLLMGLKRLEYRGYDSCGIATIKNKNLFLRKRAGKIKQLEKELENSFVQNTSLCILHTRWATHGRPNKINAHPHLDSRRKIAIVHNGIIENYSELKEKLKKQGVRFVSETDSEVISHLIRKFYQGSLQEAVQKAIEKLKGSFAIGVICLDEPEVLVVARKGSPLIIGLGEKGNFLASDVSALLPFTKRVIYLKDKQLAVLDKETIKVFGSLKESKTPKIDKITQKAEEAEKGGYEHFMLKEICEQPKVLRKIISAYSQKQDICFPEMTLKKGQLRKINKIYITACGTAYHAGYAGKYFIEKYCGIDVEIDTSSEFRYRKVNFVKNSLLIAISQSGETADTLAAVMQAKKKGARVLSICNSMGSSLVKESDSCISTLAGLEIGVASTKAYTAQVFCLYLFSLYLGRLKGTVSKVFGEVILRELKRIPQYQAEILKNSQGIKRIANKFSKFGSFLFLGRGVNFPSALEGALKLKEISYIPAEGYPAGEMKHGPIALIDEYRAVVCVAPKDQLYEKMVSNIQEVKARKGKVLAILNKGDKEASLLSDDIIYIPKVKVEESSPFLVAVCLQLFSYFVAKNLKCEIDQPRNLAKSVTVE